jgi:hypothetical protein
MSKENIDKLIEIYGEESVNNAIMVYNRNYQRLNTIDNPIQKILEARKQLEILDMNLDNMATTYE